MKQRIFLDLDGTLAEWKKTAKVEELYEKGYFSNLKAHINLITAISEIISDDIYEVFILSKFFSDSIYAKNEKIRWISKYLPEIDRKHIILVSFDGEKIKHVPGGVNPADILLDDYTPNLTEWEDAGGIPIKFINGVNDTTGIWKGAKIYMFEKNKNNRIIESPYDILKCALLDRVRAASRNLIAEE